MLSLIIGQFYWLVERNPQRQMHRGFPLNAHDLLNEGIAMSLESYRIVQGKQIQQEVQALGVMSPHPYYPEDFYNLWDSSIGFRDVLIESIFVPDLSSQGISERVNILTNFIHPYKKQLQESGLVSPDPYHHALKRGIYSDRQLLQDPFGEKACPKNLSEEEKRLFLGFCSLHIVDSIDSLRCNLNIPLPKIYSERQLIQLKKIMEDIK